jgi:hypothetical protein
MGVVVPPFTLVRAKVLINNRHDADRHSMASQRGYIPLAAAIIIAAIIVSIGILTSTTFSATVTVTLTTT